MWELCEFGLRLVLLSALISSSCLRLLKPCRHAAGCPSSLFVAFRLPPPFNRSHPGGPLPDLPLRVACPCSDFGGAMAGRARMERASV